MSPFWKLRAVLFFCILSFILMIRGMLFACGDNSTPSSDHIRIATTCVKLADEAYAAGEERVVKTLANNGAIIVLVSTIVDYTSEAIQDAKDNGVYMVVSGQDKYREDNFGASAIIDSKGNVLTQFTDRTGRPNQTYEQMQYRKGEDGSLGYTDIEII